MNILLGSAFIGFSLLMPFNPFSLALNFIGGAMVGHGLATLFFKS